MHISQQISKCCSSLYALKILRSEGMPDKTIHNIFKSIVISRLTYACQSWCGFINKEQENRLNKFIKSSIKFNYCDPNTNLFNLINNYDNKLFKTNSLSKL